MTFFLVAFDVSIPTGGGREISVNQIVDNVQSVFFSTEEDTLAGTIDWRLQWWTGIINDTFHGKNFWSGSGFGNNLAKMFGIDDGTPNRSPHNGHLTILAREGVPGFVMWMPAGDDLPTALWLSKPVRQRAEYALPVAVGDFFRDIPRELRKPHPREPRVLLDEVPALR